MMSYHKFKGLVPIAAARSDVVSSQEQITAASYTHHGVCPLMFQMHFPSHFLSGRRNARSLPLQGMASILQS